jgi:hypothetical protein
MDGQASQQLEQAEQDEREYDEQEAVLRRPFRLQIDVDRCRGGPAG